MTLSVCLCKSLICYMRTWYERSSTIVYPRACCRYFNIHIVLWMFYICFFRIENIPIFFPCIPVSQVFVLVQLNTSTNSLRLYVRIQLSLGHRWVYVHFNHATTSVLFTRCFLRKCEIVLTYRLCMTTLSLKKWYSMWLNNYLIEDSL